MYNRIRCSVNRLKGLTDNVFSRLCQNLHRNIIRDQLPIDQSTQKIVFCLGCSRESNLDFLESDLHKHLEELHLLLEAHRLDECLITVTQINAAPYRRFCDAVLFHPVIGCL